MSPERTCGYLLTCETSTYFGCALSEGLLSGGAGLIAGAGLAAARRANHFGLPEIVSSPGSKNISVLPKYKSAYGARLTRQEGRIMIVTNVRWDAVDVKVPITNGA
jgi:hypothetical protein